MIVSEKRILELQQIIKEEYGREVTLAEASEIGNGLVGYFDLLAKMHHKNNEDESLCCQTNKSKNSKKSTRSNLVKK